MEHKKKFYIKIFGCLFNHADATRIRTVLNKAGYQEASSEKEAHMVFVVTCSVRERAEHKAIHYANTIARTRDVLVTGCMVRRDFDDTHTTRTKAKIKQLLKHMPKVKAFFDITNIKNLPQIIQKMHGQKYVIEVERPSSKDYYDQIPPTIQLTQSQLIASVPIMTGCAEFCTYCIVPYTRGEEVFRSLDSILKEVTTLLSKGIKVIYLVGQIVNKWHYDRYTFLDLLKAVTNIQKEFWLGFTSPHPNYITTQLLQFINQSPKMLKTLGLPLQSGSNRILKAMNRRYTRDEFLEKALAARTLIKDAYLTTDVIVGFPPESDDDFLLTLDIIKKIRFDKIFAAKYSPRHNFHKKIVHNPDYQKTVSHRYNTLNKLAEKIFAENNMTLRSRTFKTLITSSTQGLTVRNQIVDLISPAPTDLIGKFAPVQIIDGGRRGIQGKILHTS